MNITSIKKCLNIRKNGYHRWFFINLPAFIGSNNEFYSASLNTERDSELPYRKSGNSSIVGRANNITFLSMVKALIQQSTPRDIDCYMYRYLPLSKKSSLFSLSSSVARNREVL